MHYYIDMVAHTTAFDTPVVGHWLGKSLTQQYTFNLSQLWDNQQRCRIHVKSWITQSCKSGVKQLTDSKGLNLLQKIWNKYKDKSLELVKKYKAKTKAKDILIRTLKHTLRQCPLFMRHARLEFCFGNCVFTKPSRIFLIIHTLQAFS